MFRRCAQERRIAHAIAAYPNEFLPEVTRVPRPCQTFLPLRFRLANLPEKPPMEMTLVWSRDRGDQVLLSVYLTHWYEWSAVGAILQRLDTPRDFSFRITADQELYAECTLAGGVAPETVLTGIRHFVRQLGVMLWR